MYNIAEIYIISAILFFGGCMFCLIAGIIEHYLDDEPRLKRPKHMAEYNDTVDRR